MVKNLRTIKFIMPFDHTFDRKKKIRPNQQAGNGSQDSLGAGAGGMATGAEGNLGGVLLPGMSATHQIAKSATDAIRLQMPLMCACASLSQ